MPPVIGRALEGVGELEDAPVVAGAPHDLQPDRETLRSEACGDGDGGMTGHRDARAGSHPLDVGRHWRAVDLSRVGDVGGEGRDLRDGKQEEFVLPEKVVHVAVDLGTQARGAADIGPREGASLLDIPDDGVLQLVAVVVEKITVAQFEVPGAKDVEHLVGAAQVGLGLDEIDAQVCEDAALGLEHRRGVRIDR